MGFADVHYLLRFVADLLVGFRLVVKSLRQIVVVQQVVLYIHNKSE